MKKLMQVISLFLVFVLSASIFPAESFHHHEGEQIICKKTETHFDEHAVACDLCDFILKEYTTQHLVLSLVKQVKVSQLLAKVYTPVSKNDLQSPAPRGPPFVA